MQVFGKDTYGFLHPSVPELLSHPSFHHLLGFTHQREKQRILRSILGWDT